MTGLAPPHAAEYDTDPPRDPALAARNYVVCATPRSGSGLLCRGLTAARVAGTPTEYFNPIDRGELTRRWGTGPSLREYVHALRSRRTTPAGVFGTKLHWEQLQHVRAEALGLPPGDPGFAVDAGFLEELLPRPSYVHILRLDVNRQAISMWAAAETNVFSVAREATGSDGGVRYSFAGIEHCRRRIVSAELHWDRFFRHNGITPVEVVYEDLLADYEATLRRVLAHVAPDAEDVAIGPPRSGRQSGERTDALAARFARELERSGPAPELPVAARVRRRLRRAARGAPS